MRTAARRLIERFFGGSADVLVLRLLEDEHLTPQQLEQLKKQCTSQLQAMQRRKEGRP